MVKDRKCHLFTDSHSILVRWWNHFSQLSMSLGLVIVRVKYTTESLVAEPSAFEVEMAVEKLKRHRSSAVDRIPAEMFEAGCRTIRSEIHKLNKSIWNKE